MLAEKLLITFGCSWTYGVGVNYQSGMSQKEWHSKAWDSDICDSLSWRGLLSKKFNFCNLNYAQGGSSNDKQFRSATEFFGSQKYLELREKFDKIIVIWGITSTARTELWSILHGRYYNFFLSENDNFSRFIAKYCYDHDAEVFRLRNLMLFWNVFFQGQQIKNYWFDTFNTHNYDHEFIGSFDGLFNLNNKNKQTSYQSIAGPDWPSYSDFCQGNLIGVPPKIVEEITKIFGRPRLEKKDIFQTVIERNDHTNLLDPITNLLDYDQWPRDLMSWLMSQFDIAVSENRQNYHYSTWHPDRDGMEKLINLGLLNPYSYHPTKKAHMLLCDFFTHKLQKELV
jgi:hypothetical protein